MDQKVHPVKIFIGYDSSQAVACHVLHESIISKASRPVDIQFLNLKRLCFNRPWDPLQSTEFTYTRFLVPWLMGYRGTALFMDCDMLVLDDIVQLLDKPIEDSAICCVQHDHKPLENVKMGGKAQHSYPRKNWSSLMLLNCSLLTMWSKDFVETATAAQLHRFEGIEKIASLSHLWNVLDSWEPGTKNLHYTSGGPWLPGCETQPSAELWWTHAEILGFGQKAGLIERWMDRSRNLCEAKSANRL